MYSRLNENIHGSEREAVRNNIVSSLQTEGTIDRLLASISILLLQKISDSVAIDLVQDDGSLLRVITRHREPEKEHFLVEHRRTFPMALTSSYGYPRVIKTGKSQFIPGVSERIANRLFPEADLILDGLAVRSFICVPLVAQSRILGAMTLLTTSSMRSFDGDDLLFFEDIAKLLGEKLDQILHLPSAT